MKRQKVVIEEFNGLYNLYNEAGQLVEQDFETYSEAEDWANENGFNVVKSFYL